MVSGQDIEGYLIKMGLSYDEIGENTWIIHDEVNGVDNLVVSLNAPVVLFQVKLMDIPDGCDRLKLYEKLLTLNAGEMLHGAYGLEGNTVLAIDTLQAENLDFNEFQASVDSLSLAITTHYKTLLPLMGKRLAS